MVKQDSQAVAIPTRKTSINSKDTIGVPRQRIKQQSAETIKKEDDSFKNMKKTEIHSKELNSSSNMNDVEMLGIIIKPNVIFNNDSTFIDSDLDSGSKSENRNKILKKKKSFQISPIDDQKYFK